eukprot:7872562-Alexandrium_andersonii.AAC.1
MRFAGGPGGKASAVACWTPCIARSSCFGGGPRGGLGAKSLSAAAPACGSPALPADPDCRGPT